MKIKHLLMMLLFAVIAPCAANAQQTEVIINDEGHPTNSALPTNTEHDYSYTQQIYTAEEIHTVGVIKRIAFKVDHSPSGNTRSLVVYMANTDKATFESPSDVIPISEAIQVYSGDFNLWGSNRWVEINLPGDGFYYDGRNLAIIVDDNTGSNIAVTFFDSFKTYNDHNVQIPQAVSFVQDGSDIDPANPRATTNYTQNSKSQIRLLIDVSPIQKPMNLMASDITSESATLRWTFPDATSYSYQYRADGESTWTTGTTDNPSVSLTGLTATTSYTFQVKAILAEGESEWSNALTFTTACPAPTGLTVSNLTATSADLSWTGTSESYTVAYAEVVVNTMLSADFEDGTIPTGFTNDATYPWTVTTDVKHAGTYAIKSGNGNVDSSTSEISYQVTLSSEATLTFWAKISSEDEEDKGYFSIDGTDKINGISGAGDWIEYTYTLAAGSHTLRWYYTRDYCFDDYDDCFYVDDITIMSNSVDSWTETAGITASPYTMANLTPETTYQVKVKGDCGESEWSNVLTFTTTARPPFTKEITGYGTGTGNWYLIASPLADNVAPTNVGGMITADEGEGENIVHTYDLYRFDQAQDLEWRNYRATAFDLVNGQGYLYASKEGTTLVFTGMPYSGNTKDVTLNTSTGASMSGWNLVGNPFNEIAYIDMPFYTLDGDSEYDENNAGDAINPMQGVLVHTDDEATLTFSTTPLGKSSRLTLNLTQGRSIMDRAILSFNESEPLPKLQLRENSTKVYFPVDGKDYAVVSAKESMGEMPVSFKAETNGTYTISLNTEEVNFSYLHLIDNMTGNDVDLITNPSYHFAAKVTDYESRFKLVFATGSSTSSDTFAFYSNGSWIINNPSTGSGSEATLQVIDVNGRIIKSESINGCTKLNLNVAPGVYMFRLMNGDSVKTQKVVVR